MATKYFVKLDENGEADSIGFSVNGPLPEGTNEISGVTYQLFKLVEAFGFDAVKTSLTTVKGMIE